MSIIHLKKQSDSKNINGSVIAEIAGMVAVAGVTAAMALRDKKTRENTKKMLINAKDQAINYIENLEIQVNAQGGAGTIKKAAK